MKHLDKVGIVASVICAAQCTAVPLLLAFGSVAALDWLDKLWIDYVFLIIALFVGIFAHVQGFKRHRRCEPALLAVSGIVGIILSIMLWNLSVAHHYAIAAGGILVATSHALNHLLCKTCYQC